LSLAAVLAAMFFAGQARAGLEHAVVRGVSVVDAERTGPSGVTRISWAALSSTQVPVGAYTLGFTVPIGPSAVDAGAEGTFAVEIPVCQNRGRLRIDGAWSDLTPGPAIVPLDPASPHRLDLEVRVSPYEKRIACARAPVFGAVEVATVGLVAIDFESPHAAAGGGRAVAYVPSRHDPRAPGALLVGVHPWNGAIWTYAAYAELLDAADAEDVPLLMPSGLGNSLYTADAEDEVMRAAQAVSRVVAVDPARRSIWGASMGGQGATTIGLHRPSEFASITSYFGDARFDVSGYVRSILPTEEKAHAVNPLDVIDNARHVPVWLIHGTDDATSPVKESDLLKAALDKRAYSVRYDRVPGAGHEAPLVVRFLPEVVRRAATARAPRFPSRVTYRSVRAIDTGAYGVEIERARAGDAFVDVEHKDGAIHVLAADNVAKITLRDGALAAAANAPVVLGGGVKVTVVR
jgi:dienelactone hydrolase